MGRRSIRARHSASSLALSSQPRTAQNQLIIAKIDRNMGDADSAIEAYLTDKLGETGKREALLN